MAELRVVLEEMRLKSLTKSPPKDRREEKRKKSRRRRSSGSESRSKSGSRSSNSRRSDRSGSRSGSRDKRRRYVRLRAAHRSPQRCSTEAFEQTENLHLRKRKDLLHMTSAHPGTMGAHLLLQVRRKLMKGPPRDTRDLARTDVASWASSTSMCDVKELRDIKDIQMLGRLMSLVGEGKIEEALDTIALRIREVRMANMQGSSWEKVAALSPLSASIPVNTPLPDGALTL